MAGTELETPSISLMPQVLVLDKYVFVNIHLPLEQQLKINLNLKLLILYFLDFS